MRALLLIAALFTATPALAQTAPAPRETVTAVAAAIRDRYFDPARGDEIADGLEAEAAAGAWDGLTEPRDLANALGIRLRPLDAHFNVVYDPQAPQGPPPGPRPRAEGPPPPRGANPAEVRGNFGFRAVQILPGNVGYIDLRQFSNIDFRNPDDPARRAADAALAFVSGADAVIFDLRDNGGGAPSMVGYLTSAFTARDADIYNVFHSREGTQSEAPEVYYATPRLETPVFILTSGRTGSAGEAFPYTLQAARRATIVGEASAGAANPGGMAPVGGGFAVFVSGGSPRNAITGRNWEGTGVQPDVSVPQAEALTRAHELALEAILAKDAGRADATWTLEAMRNRAEAGDLAVYAGTYGDQTVSIDQGALRIMRGRRPAVVLTPIGEDLFTVSNDPTRRFRFLRDEAGRVTAFESLAPFGPGPRARRTD